MGGQQSTEGQPKQPGEPDVAPGSAGMVSASSGAKAPKNKVQLAVSVLGGVQIPGLTAYHSSVVVNGEEFFFSDGGIAADSNLSSHKNPQMPDNQPTIIDMGFSQYSGSQLKAALERHFLPGTYDLLRKNCNSFSDTAIFYLLHKRIDAKYRAMEKMGASMQGMVAAASEYRPNPKAEGFDVDALCKEIDPEKVWSTPGQATGGATVTSAEAMRAARLARLGGGGGAPAPAASGSPAATQDPL
mmetsp:Transcript_13611/g.39218  ORF Transcript_13611/g.39218 Transcript_13611/m.39218 type:complete len:243 (-) Transcript_13611:1-729(-)